MSKQARKSCPHCGRLQELVTQLQGHLKAQATQITSLQAEVLRLQEKLAAAQKDSSTSSKPPSSDIVKPPPATGAEGSERRKIGGQPGHPQHERQPLAPAQMTHFEEYVLDVCLCCGGGLRRNVHFARAVQPL